MRLIAIAFGFLASLAACAEEAPAPAETSSPEKYQQGVHYEVLPQPVRTVTPGKIEVTEAYSYACGHCYKFEPIIQAWDKKQGDDVELVKLPVIWSPNMKVLARTMYTGEALGMAEEVNEAVFEHIHQNKKHIQNEDDVAEIFAKLGVDKEKFSKTFNSFGVSSQVQQAESRTRSMNVTGTPQMIVNGKYSISAKNMGHEGMLDVVDYLVAKIKAEE